MGSFLDFVKAANPLSAVASLGSSVVNAFSQHETNKANAEQNDLSREFSAQQAQLDRDFNAAQSEKQNAFNALEANKSRVFNADQARQQMEFQERMWNAQNDYNDPSAQLARLKAAGINPNWNDGFDNTAGSVSGGAAATSSPASGSPASHGSVGAPGNIPMSPVTIENPLMMAAQIRLANATAEKAENDAERVRKLLPGEIDSQNMNLRLGEKSLEMSDSQIAEIKSRMDVQASQLKNLDAQTSKIARENDLLSLDEKQKNILLKYYEEELVADLMHKKNQLGIDDATIKHIASQIALNYENQILVGSQSSLNYDAHLLNGIQLQYAGKMAKLTYDSSKNQYDIDVLRGVTDKRQAAKRSVDSWLNHTFDTLDLITNTVGNVFGNVPQYLYKK